MEAEELAFPHWSHGFFLISSLVEEKLRKEIVIKQQDLHYIIQVCNYCAVYTPGWMWGIANCYRAFRHSVLRSRCPHMYASLPRNISALPALHSLNSWFYERHAATGHHNTGIRRPRLLELYHVATWQGLRIYNKVAPDWCEFYPLKWHNELTPLQFIMLYEAHVIWKVKLTL